MLRNNESAAGLKFHSFVRTPAVRPHHLLPLGEGARRADEGIAAVASGAIVPLPNRQSPHPALKRATFSQREKEVAPAASSLP